MRKILPKSADFYSAARYVCKRQTPYFPVQESGEGLSNAPHDGRLNLFFALDGSLAKVLNALRLDDAP